MDSDEETIHHFYCHEHPLRWIPNPVAENQWKGCSGCGRSISPGEAVYECDECCSISFHQDCAEMPRQIRHAMHPSHLLTLSRYRITYGSSCAVCAGLSKYGLIYACSEGCAMMWIHLVCAGGSEAAEEPATETMHHPSHPRHELRLQRRRKDSCSFHCNACGTVEKGNSYICSICNYWIHQSCADSPETKDFPLHHPNHPLSLSFYLPNEYAIYEYACAICDGALGLRRWVYHCRICRYVVHINCATATNPAAHTHQLGNENRSVEAIEGPINNIYEELIKDFVKKQLVFMHMRDDCREIISGKYKFHKHDHSLSFTKFNSSHHNVEDEDDDDDDDLRLASVITCDACTLPIHQKNSSSESGYMFCGECDYFLHLACFNLPPELSSHPLHPKKDHQLTLVQSCNKLKDWSRCYVCWCSTNGLFYACTQCDDFKLDIKCASLPDAMKHAGHPRPHHSLKLVAGNHWSSVCSGCYYHIYTKQIYYSCDSCRFSLCLGCVFLPASNRHRLEKHRLPLTYDASVNHPSDFYCGSCEEKMHPRMWMYHCRHCDESFHPTCFPASSGGYRNINFGSHQHYTMNVTTLYHHPHHPLKFQIITKKKYCDLCCYFVYEKHGFQCADCNFVSCMEDHPSVSLTPSSTYNNSQFLLL